MAVLYITEYAELGIGKGGRVGQMPKDAPIAEQTVAIGGASLQSAAFNIKTQLIRIHCDAICSILVGVNPTVTATSARMAANQTEYHDVSSGALIGTPYKIAVITNT